MKTLKSLILCLIVILGVSSNALAAPLSQATLDILYVKVTGTSTNSCYNWTDACDLQTALNYIGPAYEIWVASGTYVPTAIPTDRTATFRMKSGVAVYGGFAGTETQLDQRDWEANPTILSGDLNGDDGENFANNSENSYHVVIGNGVDETAALDGFTITGGHTSSYSDDPNNYQGGGIYNKDGSPTLTNLIFTKNMGAWGGGIFNENGSPILKNITFYRNNAINHGGGIVNDGGNPSLTDISFSENTATASGGGMYNTRGNPTLTNITFSDNTADQFGGGMRNVDSSPTLTNVTFSGNKATGNPVGGGGGGMYNSAFFVIADPKLTNVTFFQNEAKVGGGILNTTNGSDPINTPIAKSTIINAIFWGNTNGQIVNNSNASATVSYSIIEGGYTGTGNVTTDDPKIDPLLADNGGFTMTHALQAGSPAIDAGNPDSTTCPATDQRGFPRPLDGDGNGSATCDIGAVEFSDTLYAIPGSTGNCSSWSTACELRQALSIASPGVQIWAAAGTYKPTTSDPDPRMATFQLKSGVAVYGGFAGTETQLEERDWEANPTILSGDIGTAEVDTDNSYHVVTASGVDATTILDGFTITGGNTNSEGGGMYNKDSSPTLSNLIFTNNKGAVGGGMYNENGSPILTNITFYRNNADAGGGMFNRNGKPTLTNVTFSENTTNQLGGGMHNEDSSPTLTNVTFSRNKAIDYGGGMCNVANNGTTNPKLTNVTFFQNEAGEKGGGIVHIAYTGLPDPIAESTIINAIFWGNTNGQIVDNVGDPTTVTNSIVQDGCPIGVTCTDIITDDPKLDSILADNGGFSMTHALQAGSPAIDAGDQAVCAAILTDQRGVSRSIDGDLDGTATCDIGAYEWEIKYYMPLIIK